MQRRYDIDDVNECIAWVAAFFTVTYYIPKIAPFINVLQGLVNFEDTPGFNITICYINCLFWFLYGELLFSDQMKYGYMITFFICLISMSIYIIYEIKKYFFDSVLNFLIVSMGSWALYRYFTVEFDDDALLGKICIASSLIVYFHHLYNIYRVIKEKNLNLIHYYNTIIHLLALLFWCIYGIIDKDNYIAISYGIGVILTISEIIVYKCYKKKFPLIVDKNSISTIGIESAGNEESKKEETTIKIDEDDKEIKAKKVKIINKFE